MTFSGRFKKEVALVEKAVCSAAEYLVDFITSGKSPEVFVKPDASLVMTLDIESQKHMLAALKDVGPIVAEEDPESHKLIETASSYFTLDPLDGTTSCRRFMNIRGGQVGFGPLVGYVSDGRMSVAGFYSVPHRKLYTAVIGEGVYVCDMDFEQGTKGETVRLIAEPCTDLTRAGVLFYIGTGGESKIMQHLRTHNSIENMYRFGGFANDCARLAHGYEQVSIQFAVKAWDFPGTLFCHEAGLKVVVDPTNTKTELSQWRVAMNNPAIIVHAAIREPLLKLVDEALGS